MKAHRRISNHNTWISDELVEHLSEMVSDVLVPIARLALTDQREMGIFL